jgi:hypothetical protein
MGKWILRTVILLAVAALVCGAIFLVVNNTSASTSGFGSGEGFQRNFQGGTGTFPAGGFEGVPGRGHGDREGGSASLGGILLNFIKVAVVTLVVSLIGLISRKVIHRLAAGQITG